MRHQFICYAAYDDIIETLALTFRYATASSSSLYPQQTNSTKMINSVAKEVSNLHIH